MKKIYDYMLNEEVTVKTEEINKKDCTYITPHKSYVGRVIMSCCYLDCILVEITNDMNVLSHILVGKYKCAHTLSNWQIVE